MTNRRNSARQDEEEDEGMTNAQRTKGKGKKNKSAFLAAAAAFDLVFSGEASRFSWGLEIVLRAVTHSEARLRVCKKSFWRHGGEKKT